MDDGRAYFRAEFDGELLELVSSTTARSLVFVKDEAGRYLYINPAMEELFGVRAADVEGREAGAWLPANIANTVRRHDARVLEAG